MVYRKMYMYAAIVVVQLIADAVLETYFPLPEAVGKAVTWGVYAVFSIMGNMMYKTHTDKKSEKNFDNFYSSASERATG